MCLIIAGILEVDVSLQSWHSLDVSFKSWHSLDVSFKGDEQLDRPNSQTTVELCHASVS